MVRSSGDQRSGASRRIVGLAVAVIVAVVLYSVAWFYLAGQLQGRVEGLIAGLQEDDIAARCDGLDVRGYPFRIGVFCDSLSASAVAGGPSSLATGAFRSAAQIYRPGHIVSELDGPARMTLDGGGVIDAAWQSLRASTVFSTSALERASIEGGEISAGVTVPGLPGFRLSAGQAEAHAREVAADLDLAFRAEDLRIDGGLLPPGLPALDLIGEARMAGGAGFLSGRRLEPGALRGTSGALTNTGVTLDGGASFRLSGPFDIAQDGLISGTFDLVVNDPDRWEETLTTLLPGARGTIETAGNLMRAFGGGGGDDLTLDIRVRDGRAAIGIIPIGSIPPI